MGPIPIGALARVVLRARVHSKLPKTPNPWTSSRMNHGMNALAESVKQPAGLETT